MFCAKFNKTNWFIRMGLFLCCIAQAQNSAWSPVSGDTGLTWRWQTEAGPMQNCQVEVREGEKLRKTTANLTVVYLRGEQKLKSAQTVSFEGRDIALFHVSACRRVEAIVADRVRRK